ncbi:transposase [Klebsiella pneumoniae]
MTPSRRPSPYSLSIGGVYGHITFAEFGKAVNRSRQGYSIAEVSERLGVSTAHSLYKWLRAVKLTTVDSRHRIYWMPERNSRAESTA